MDHLCLEACVQLYNSLSPQMLPGTTKRSRNRRVGECVYCGELGPVSRDHIPPSNLFAQPRPSNLITVPACDRCNSAASLDDEYFRLAITAGIDPARFPDESALSLEAIHKLSAPQKRGLAKTMLSNFSKRPLLTPAGLYLGEIGALNIEASRIQRVVSRVVRGLYFHHLGKRLLSTHTISVLSDWLSPDFPDKDLLADVQAILEWISLGESREIGCGIFSYRYRMLEEDAGESIWWLCFYDHRRFLCSTQEQDGLVQQF